MPPVQHTPGPWYVGAQNDGLYIISGKPPAAGNDFPRHDADRNVLAKVYDPIDGNPSGDKDAELMAAAPELLHALKEIIAANIPLRFGLRMQAEAAVAKATGGRP